MFGALKHGFRSLATLKLVVKIVGELKPKRTAAASRVFLATARFPCYLSIFIMLEDSVLAGKF